MEVVNNYFIHVITFQISSELQLPNIILGA